MSSRGDSMAINQPFVPVDVSLSHRTERRCCSMGNTEAEGTRSVSRTTMKHLDAILN